MSGVIDLGGPLVLKPSRPQGAVACWLETGLTCVARGSFSWYGRSKLSSDPASVLRGQDLNVDLSAGSSALLTFI